MLTSGDLKTVYFHLRLNRLIKPLWYSNHWECEYSLTWGLRTHKLIKFITVFFSVGAAGVHRQGLTQALTLPGTVHGTRRQGSHGQAKPPGFQGRKSSSPTFIQGVNSMPGQGTWREKCHSEGTRGLSWQAAPLGITQTGESRSSWSQGSQERSWINRPRRSSSSCHYCAKQRLQPERVLLFPHPSPLSHWPACSSGEARKGRVDVPQPRSLPWAKKQRKLLEEGDK